MKKRLAIALVAVIAVAALILIGVHQPGPKTGYAVGTGEKENPEFALFLKDMADGKILTEGPVRSPPCGSYGDFDGDGFVTENDSRACFYQVGLDYMQVCDVNGNGLVECVDAVAIYAYVNWSTDTFTVCPTTTTSSSTTVTTTTSTIMCPLLGDYPPCDDVSTEEVIDLIQLWVDDEVSLSSIIRLIDAWVAGR